MTAQKPPPVRQLPRLKSLDRISKIPVVETGYNLASTCYSKIKNCNFLVRWSLNTMEGTLHMVVDKSCGAVHLIEIPLAIVDGLVCKGLETVEQRVPAIAYPPQMLVSMTKEYVSSRVIQPVMKRADSVKQLSLTEASKYSEMAVTRLDTALDLADKYVDRYLPDATDTVDTKDVDGKNQNKTKKAIEHANRLSRKLKRRLTRRTIAEAQALKRQGIDAMQCLLYFADLLIRDPKQFVEKIRSVWAHLSEDEPENQVPPANLEQVVALVTREAARRMVHVTNFTASTVALLPRYSIHLCQLTTHHLGELLSYLLKEAMQVKLRCASKADDSVVVPIVGRRLEPPEEKAEEPHPLLPPEKPALNNHSPPKETNNLPQPPQKITTDI